MKYLIITITIQSLTLSSISIARPLMSYCAETRFRNHNNLQSVILNNTKLDAGDSTEIQTYQVGSNFVRIEKTDTQYESMIKQVEVAKNDLAERLSIEVHRIKLGEIRKVIWPDSSLGCPEAGIKYVPNPRKGYLIRFSVEQKIYFYHCNEGSDPFYCEKSSKMVPRQNQKFDEWIPKPHIEID